SVSEDSPADPSPLAPDSSPLAMILDFCLARQQQPGEPLTQTGAIVGTWGYMAPEQIDGQELDARSDLYSLGCVLYRMVTGKLPFEGATLTKLLRAVAAGRFTPVRALRPDVRPRLCELIERMIARDREERPASAREVAQSLSLLTPLPSPLNQHRSLSRRLIPAGLLAAIVLLAVGTTALVIHQSGGPNSSSSG